MPNRLWRKQRAGITRISGDIIGDGSYFKGERHHGDWSIEDEQTKDGVVPCGLTWRGQMGDSPSEILRNVNNQRGEGNDET